MSTVAMPSTYDLIIAVRAAHYWKFRTPINYNTACVVVSEIIDKPMMMPAYLRAWLFKFGESDLVCIMWLRQYI